ncbi:endonuclease/exonuclease/phosphatase family protein [Sphingobacterium mizutaii]|uniref:endonuclease/exonuclease/phosphatase family protein n=1 Tax=Sphingobacterium mizutaii TaxID=1010 RepID=UPI0028A82D29|nr:endonuclease/exonuclease/phosphatase family protein [Sphingobacterium mizutaii]
MKRSETSNRREFFKKVGLLTAMPLLAKLDLQAEQLPAKGNQIKVLTCNIRVDLEEDAAKGLGWKDRREACLAVIKNQKADLIGFQEVLKGQFLDLKENLKDYFAFGFDGPEMDAFKEGYHGIAKNPILFSKKRFELLVASAYWLSETPLKAGSLSWGSARARNAVFVRLLDKKTNKEIRLTNLHLDHVSNEAKEGQIKVVLEEAAQYQSDFPQILTGDFNVGMDSKVYRDVIAAGWKDSYVQVKGNETPEGTTHGFKGNDPNRKKSKKIDFIFLNGPLKAIDTNIIKDSFKGVLPSDHYFVSAVLEYQ